MKDYLERLMHFCAKKLGKVVYVGAGAGTKVVGLCDLRPRELVAIEGSDELFKALHRKLKKHENVTLINKWLFPGEDSSGEVYFYNNPRFNSLEKLHDLLQGNVKLTEQRQVEGISIKSMLSELNASKDELNVLFLDTRADFLFLESAEGVKTLSIFDFIICVSTYKVEGCEKVTDIKSKGFFQIPCSENSEFTVFQRQDDIIELGLQYDFLIQENSALKANLTSAEESTADKEAELVSLRDQLQKFEEEFMSSRNRFSETEQNLRGQLKESQDENTKLLTAKEQLLKEKDELIEQRDNHQRHHMENKQWAESLNNNNKETKAENRELKTSLENEKSNVLKLEKDYASLLREKQVAEERLSKTERISEMNLKLLTKSQADVDELRSQLREKSQRVDELILLIANLHQKLEKASLFYEDLKKTNPELLQESL